MILVYTSFKKRRNILWISKSWYICVVLVFVATNQRFTTYRTAHEACWPTACVYTHPHTHTYTQLHIVYSEQTKQYDLETIVRRYKLAIRHRVCLLPPPWYAIVLCTNVHLAASVRSIKTNKELVIIVISVKAWVTLVYNYSYEHTRITLTWLSILTP